MAAKKRVGVVLFQLGGPDSPDAVEPFLRNLFMDPDIIPMGPMGFLRAPLARYIARKRSVPVAGRYAMIGRRSPIQVTSGRPAISATRASGSVARMLRYPKTCSQSESIEVADASIRFSVADLPS